MKPLQSVAMGLVVVAVTARFGAVDALADPVGWLLVALGVAALPDLPHRGAVLRAVGVAAAVSVVLWVPAAQAWLDGEPEAVRWAVNLPQLVALVLLCLAIGELAGQGRDPGARAWWRMLLALVVVVAVLPVLVHGAGIGALEQASYVAAGLSVLAAIVLAFSHSGRPWAVAQRPAG